MTTNKKILFLGTGNYYRSRFSEHLFNALAAEKQLNWRAESRGLELELGVNNIGAISPHAIKGLRERGLTVPENERFPIQAVDADLAIADKIIALDEYEHRWRLEKLFPHWKNVVEYWMVHDLDQTSPALALPQIEKHISQLIGFL